MDKPHSGYRPFLRRDEIASDNHTPVSHDGATEKVVALPDIHSEPEFKFDDTRPRAPISEHLVTGHNRDIDHLTETEEVLTHSDATEDFDNSPFDIDKLEEEIDIEFPVDITAEPAIDEWDTLEDAVNEVNQSSNTRETLKRLWKEMPKKAREFMQKLMKMGVDQVKSLRRQKTESGSDRRDASPSRERNVNPKDAERARLQSELSNEQQLLDAVEERIVSISGHITEAQDRLQTSTQKKEENSKNLQDKVIPTLESKVATVKPFAKSLGSEFFQIIDTDYSGSAQMTMSGLEKFESVLNELGSKANKQLESKVRFLTGAFDQVNVLGIRRLAGEKLKMSVSSLQDSVQEMRSLMSENDQLTISIETDTDVLKRLTTDLGTENNFKQQHRAKIDQLTQELDSL